VSFVLSPAQLERLDEYRKKWTTIGESCEPTDIETCRPFAEDIYRAAGAEPPQYVIRADSPLDSAATVSMLSYTSAIDFLQLFFDPVNLRTIARTHERELGADAPQDAVERVAQDFFYSAVRALDLAAADSSAGTTNQESEN